MGDDVPATEDQSSCNQDAYSGIPNGDEEGGCMGMAGDEGGTKGLINATPRKIGRFLLTFPGPFSSQTVNDSKKSLSKSPHQVGT